MDEYPLSGHCAFNKPPAAFQAAFICPVCPGGSLRSTPGCIPPTFQAEEGLVPREEMKNQHVYKDMGCTPGWVRRFFQNPQKKFSY